MNIIILGIYSSIAIALSIFINSKFVSQFEENMKKTVCIITYIGVDFCPHWGEFSITVVKKICFQNNR